jgi:hypothetical protein
VFVAYLFEDSRQWFVLLERHSNYALAQRIQHGVELVMLIALALMLLPGLRRLMAPKQRTNPDARSALLLVAYLLLSMPLVLLVLSYLTTPVFVSRYWLPCGIGLAIALADFADGLGADRQTSSRFGWGAAALFLAISPVLSAMVRPPLDASWRFLDVRRLDQIAPPNIAVVAEWQDDFAKLMRYSHSPRNHYYFLLDWPVALAGPLGYVADYHLMSAYRDAGYYSQNIQDNDRFLCSHTDFLVLDTYLSGQEAEGPTWFEQTVKKMPQFQWKILDSFDGPEAKRTLISVHRQEPLPFCNQP